MSSEEVSDVPTAGTPEEEKPTTPDEPEIENKPEVSNIVILGISKLFYFTGSYHWNFDVF